LFRSPAIVRHEAIWLNLRKAFRAAAAGRLSRSETGVTAIEYGLIAALIAVAIITSVTLIGTRLGTLFNSIAGRV
jgi:pilus assembly protein Flp/PilA